MKTKMNWPKTILKLLLGVIVIAAILVGIYLILNALGYSNLSQEELQKLIEKTGIYGKLVFVLISFLQVTFIPIPGAVTILVGNYLFGFWESALLSFIGMFVGALFAYFLGIAIGRRFVNWAMGGKEQVDYYLAKLKGKETVLLFFMFLLPFFPDDALCSIAGLTNIKKITFVLMQLITRPISIFATLIFMSGEIIPYEGWGLVFLITGSILCIIAFILAYKYSDQINRFLENLSNKITNKLKRKKEEK